jgi:hypothetical protein
MDISPYKYDPPYIYMKQEKYPSIRPLELIAETVNSSDVHCFIFILNIKSNFLELLRENDVVDIYWMKSLDSWIDKKMMIYYPSLKGGISAVVKMKKPFSMDSLKEVYYQPLGKNYPLGEIIVASSGEIPNSVLDAFFESAIGESDVPSRYLNIIFATVGLWSYACEYADDPSVSPSDVVIIGRKSDLTKGALDWGEKFDPMTGESIS